MLSLIEFGLVNDDRKGIIKNMTGITSPYEAPTNPDLEIFTDLQTIDESVESVLKLLNKKLNIKNE